MKGIFNSKKSPKKTSGETSTESHRSPHHHQPHLSQEKLQPQTPRSQSTSPVKPSSSSSKSPTKKTLRPASPSTREQPKPRSSRTHAKHSTEQGSSRRSKIDPNTHPLNLPPEEIKRLSAQYNMSNRNSVDKMDVDKDTSVPPTSPPPVQTQASFTVPISTPPPTNGVKNGASDDSEGPVPAPPPHRSNPSSPVPTDAEAAEAHKADGNRFFKQKDYSRAIAEYTSGMVL